MIALVGYTGFVGSNIVSAAGDTIQARYNTRNIDTAFGTRPELLIYAGLRAEKYLANSDPAMDLGLIQDAERNIERIAPKKLVLISTIDIFKDPRGVDESSLVPVDGLGPYGYHRRCLEQWVRQRYDDALIVRLPGLFGRNLKKNFIFDYMHLIPSMLRESKFAELAAREPKLNGIYTRQENGFYKVNALSGSEKEEYKELFRRIGFTSLNFTDSRSRFQFYDLSRLWNDMQTALKNDLRLWHPAVEPVSVAELYEYLSGGSFLNLLSGAPADYDYRTLYADLFGGKNGYIIQKDEVLKAVKAFVEQG